MATACRSLRSVLYVLIVHAERENTRYVPSVLLAILENSTTSVKLFLPMWYDKVVSDADV